MTLSSCQCELAQLVAYHVFSDIYRNMFSAVVNCNRMTDHIGVNCGTAGPCFDYVLFARRVHRVDFLDRKSVV